MSTVENWNTIYNKPHKVPVRKIQLNKTRSISPDNSVWNIGNFLAMQNKQSSSPADKDSTNRTGSDYHNTQPFNNFALLTDSVTHELQVMQLFFTSTPSSPKLKDVLRKYLRLLSAKRMQMGTSRNTGRLNSFQDHTIVNDLSSGNDRNLDNCSPHIQERVDLKYQHQLESIGETIAKCLQRLESLATSMEAVVDANKQIIQTFPLPQSELWKTPGSRWVMCSSYVAICNF